MAPLSVKQSQSVPAHVLPLLTNQQKWRSRCLAAGSARTSAPFQGVWANLHVSVLTCGRCSCSVHLHPACVGFLTECQGCRANVVGIARCGCHCRAGVFGCHHGDGHASPLIWALDCECGAFQGHRTRLCAETWRVDPLILAFRAALPFTTSRVYTKSVHKPCCRRSCRPKAMQQRPVGPSVLWLLVAHANMLASDTIGWIDWMFIHRADKNPKIIVSADVTSVALRGKQSVGKHPF